MSSPKLHCLIASDLLPWEKEVAILLIDELGRRNSVECVFLTKEHKNYFKRSEKEHNYWVISRNWQRALSFLGGNRCKGHLFFSVFGPPPMYGLISLFWKKFSTFFPPQTTMLTHSPMSFRYYREFGEIKKGNVKYVPLAAPPSIKRRLSKPDGAPFVVGTIAPFTPESNLNYLLSVAHYVAQKADNILFCLYGKGPLYRHYQQLVQDLDLVDKVVVKEVVSLKDTEVFDLFCYVALQNQHFIPLLNAASLEMPVLGSEIVGIEDFLEDGKSGHVIAINEVEPMGNLVLKYAEATQEATRLGKELKIKVDSKFYVGELVNAYEEVFLGTRGSTGSKLSIEAI